MAVGSLTVTATDRQEVMLMLDLGLFLIRVLVGALIAAHGLQKLVGWFGGPGIDANADILRGLGYRRPRATSWVHAGSETFAGVLLILGLVTPAAAAAVLAVMINAAIVVHAPQGLWTANGGYEYPLVLATIAVALAIMGPGAWSLDAAWLGLQPDRVWASASIGIGALAGLGGLALRTDRTMTRRTRQGTRRIKVA